MIDCPLQNNALFTTAWIQIRPRISQKFGLNPNIYAQFGLAGHNGVDYGIPIGTIIFAPFEGIVNEVGDQGDGGYGKYVRLRKNNLECVFGHLSQIFVTRNMQVHLHDKIVLSGDTGFSTGPHLHFGIRFIDNNGKILNYDNGYLGYVDPLPFMANWKGTHLKPSLP